MNNYRTHLGDWVFYFDVSLKEWQALQVKNFQGEGRGPILKSKDINTLIEIINKNLYQSDNDS